MYQSVVPLAVSAHVPTMRGELRPFSLHNKVINLVNQQEQIITLHRYNSGLSPMGISFKSIDFDEIYYQINQNAKIEQQVDNNLIIGDLYLNCHYRPLNLNIKTSFIISTEFIQAQLKPINALTGLFGPLNQNISLNLPGDLQNFVQQFVLLLQQQPYDLTPYIGLGPGLTPSYDDMMVGILTILHSDSRLSKNHLLSLTTDLPIAKLELLTTKVSAAFLNYAIQGIFTLNLLAVISLIRQYSVNSLAISKLLSYGHTSGADLLLGMWLGTLILQLFHQDEEVIRC